MASLGIGIGILIHSSYCILGLGLIISQSLFLFSLIKYLGASYLIYLGIKSLRAHRDHLPDKQLHLPPCSLWSAFQDGLLTNVLNPKCTLFMLSIFTVMIKPHTPLLYQSVYGLEIASITVVWFVILSYGLTTGHIKTRLEKAQHWVSKLIGAVLFSLGIAVLFESRH